MRNEAAVYSEMANFTENQDDVGYLPNSLLIQLLQGTLVISAETIENRPNSSFYSNSSRTSCRFKYYN